jgi:membrane-associated protein
MNEILSLILELDQHLLKLVADYGALVYGVLFGIIFAETGFVVTPFLPGDSLLFAAGSIAGAGSLNVWYVFILTFIAAVIGDTVNYWIGNFVGPVVFRKDYKFLNKEHLKKTQKFYDKHGGKTIVLARFIPIVRTFAPFVAGVGTMDYQRFIIFNVLGAFLWTSIFVFGGYFFGTIPFVQHNFEIVIIAIIILSVVPIIIEWVKGKREKKNEKDQ